MLSCLIVNFIGQIFTLLDLLAGISFSPTLALGPLLLGFSLLLDLICCWQEILSAFRLLTRLYLLLERINSALSKGWRVSNLFSFLCEFHFFWFGWGLAWLSLLGFALSLWISSRLLLIRWNTCLRWLLWPPLCGLGGNLRNNSWCSAGLNLGFRMLWGLDKNILQISASLIDHTREWFRVGYFHEFRRNQDFFRFQISVFWLINLWSRWLLLDNYFFFLGWGSGLRNWTDGRWSFLSCFVWWGSVHGRFWIRFHKALGTSFWHSFSCSLPVSFDCASWSSNRSLFSTFLRGR